MNINDITNIKRSYLVLIGGAEDKTGSKEILAKTVKVARAKRIVVIPTASNYPRDVYNNYYNAFRDLGVEEIECFDIRDPREADQERYFEYLKDTNLVFFSGGDQVKLVETLRNTNLLEEISKRFFSGTLTIAGTSAGAAAASDIMLYDGDYRGFVKGRVRSCPGFGFLPKITIDTHFLHRERIPRLVQILTSSENLNTRGIGLDENTAILIGPNLKCLTIGTGMVTLVNTESVTFSDYNYIDNDKIYSVNNLKIGFLAPGTMFSLKRWSILKSNQIKKKYFELIPEYEDQINMFFN
ncbi:MAG: cyanophycinase [Marinilabiliales bacterium]